MVIFKWDWNRAMEVRAEEAADAKTTEFVLNMLREHEPYEKISRLASTSMENVQRIAQKNNIAYRANTYTLAQHEKHRLNRPVLFNNQ